MTLPDDAAPVRPLLRFLGGLIMLAGGLIAALSGLCTVAAIGVMAITSLEELPAALPMALIVGGVPFGLGLGLFFGGREVWRAGRPASRRSDPKTFD